MKIITGETAGRSYTVVSGDTLSRIARREYGDEMKYRELHAFNRALGKLNANPNIIRVGEAMEIPTASELAEFSRTGSTTTPGGITPAFLDIYTGPATRAETITTPAPAVPTYAPVPAPTPGPAPRPEGEGMSNTTKILIGAGALAVIAAAYMVFKLKK